MAMPNVMSAQDEVNDYKFYVGGSIGFTQNSYDGDTQNTNFGISPEFGYNINDKFSAGIVLGYSRYTNKAATKDDIDLHNSTFTVNPYLRYTFMNDGRVNLFCDAGFFYKLINNESKGMNDSGKPKAVDNKTNAFGVALSPGIAYRISNRFSLVAHLGSLGYETSKPDYKDAKSTSKFGLNLANGTSFGVYFNF